MSDPDRDGSTADGAADGGAAADGSIGLEGTREGDPPRARWRPAAAFAVVVLVASVLPVPGGGTGGEGIGRLAADVISPTDPFHLVGYAVLAALSARATGRGIRGSLAAATVAVAFGFGVELVQTAIPWRTFAWRDSLVNAIGATAGVVVGWIFGPSRRDADAWSPPN
ncbi:VanZ family protein [Halorubrum rubrum]|uniref:VanZ family protein n=1 Tax=Halorubrum rubrum TaxID=1126240 RepID=A0ABD5R104_9EURY|nr:VanZ family protein [Halorubrum rubrum]